MKSNSLSLWGEVELRSEGFGCHRGRMLAATRKHNASNPVVFIVFQSGEMLVFPTFCYLLINLGSVGVTEDMKCGLIWMGMVRLGLVIF